MKKASAPQGAAVEPRSMSQDKQRSSDPSDDAPAHQAPTKASKVRMLSRCRYQPPFSVPVLTSACQSCCMPNAVHHVVVHHQCT
jgi:hypothetical protein